MSGTGALVSHRRRLGAWEDGGVSMRVMTWNVWWHFGPWEARQPAIVDTIRRVDPDVVCLQEVWSDESNDQVDVLAHGLGMHAVRTDPILYDGQSFANAILARWPLERIADDALPGADGTTSHRRIVAVRIATPWGGWPVASTHLEHRFDRSADRSAQVRRMMELTLGWRGDPTTDLPVIVGGDLNAVPDTDEIRMATGRSPGVDGIVFSDVWEQVGDGDGHTWTRGNPHSSDSAWPNRRLDYLLVSWPRPNPIGNPIRTRLAGHGGDADVWPSDHLAVVADVTTPN